MTDDFAAPDFAAPDFAPPIPLSIAATRTYQRLAAKIHGEGRLAKISTDMLAIWAQTLHLYLDCMEQITLHGVLVQGRTANELVRSPALTPMNQARAALVHLARAIPLANADADVAGNAVDAWIDQLVADVSA
jgi:phage terminase small subunit